MKVGVRGGPAKTKTRTVTRTRPHQKKGQRGEPNAKVPIEWKSAVDSLRQLQGTKRAKVRDYNDAINACAKARQLGPALELLGDMVKDGIDPDTYSYGSLLNACARTRDWKTALELLGDVSFKQVFWDNRWLPFLASKRSLDQIWLFETSGYGLSKRRGLALERNGYVVTILVLPDPLQ